jgi:nucleoside-diphosphate-sugar epimerase
MTTIAITGAAGNLGQNLIRRLAGSSYRIRALDIASSLPLEGGGSGWGSVDYHRVDVRDPDIGKYFAGCDAVLHLAFVVEKGSRDATAVEAINVGGTKNVFAAAAKAGVKHILYASSIAAYGVHPENVGVLLKEDAPIRGNEDFYYSRTQAEVERWINDFEAQHPAIKVTRFRPCIFIEPGAERSSLFSRLPFLPYFAGAESPVQLMHQDDVAQAFELALQKGAAGIFNLATEDPLPMSAWAQHTGKRGFAIPQGALRLIDLAYRTGRTDVDPTWYRFGLKYPIVVDASRARAELGWKPAYATTAAVLSALSAK